MATTLGLSVGEWQHIRKALAARAVISQTFNPKTANELWKLHEKVATYASPKSKPKAPRSPKVLPDAQG